MASKRPIGDGDGPQATKYKKVNQREHVLLRPDMYVGLCDPVASENTIIDAAGSLETKQISVSPAFLQCFEEILMNAADRVSAAHESGSTTVQRTKTIKIVVEDDTISVANDGDGIESKIIEEYDVRTPELIFGHLLSSSNYDDTVKKLNSGRQGLGAKLGNIFSTKFSVETICPTGIKYKQTFEDNMSVINPPVLTKFSGKAYTKITYVPDFARFGMEKITPDIEGILRRRCYEIGATSLSPVKMYFNGTKVPVTTIDHYAALYVPDAASRFSAIVNERWRISIGIVPDNGHRILSFCNGTATLDGGKHVDHVVDPLVKHLLSYYKKKFKTTALKPSVIKDCLTVVVSAFIENPVYNSQCKNYLSSAPDKFGSSCVVPDSLFNKITKSGLTEAVEAHLKSKEKKVLNATDGRKSSKVNVAKLHDAAKAGTRDSSKCVLFLCEGDSALTFLMSGLKSSDRDLCGCFPLKGKLLNIRDASASQIAANTEITNIKQILGLQQGKTYAESQKGLRYGSIVLLVDADTDGSHIAGLLLNVFDCFWPGLVNTGFIKIMATPIVRATGSNTWSGNGAFPTSRVG
jgi:DNA topoisomerase-2